MFNNEKDLKKFGIKKINSKDNDDTIDVSQLEESKDYGFNKCDISIIDYKNQLTSRIDDDFKKIAYAVDDSCMNDTTLNICHEIGLSPPPKTLDSKYKVIDEEHTQNYDDNSLSNSKLDASKLPSNDKNLLENLQNEIFDVQNDMEEILKQL